MNDSKRTVLERLYDFSSHGVRNPRLIRRWTLGGVGLEMVIWLERGARPECCFLVERSQRVIAKLLSLYRASDICLIRTSLRNLPAALLRDKGPQAGFDYFHLDLNGTIEPVLCDVTGILALLARGSGRCLAVTRADSRQNQSIQASRLTRQLALHLLGKEGWERFLSHTQDLRASETEARGRSYNDQRKFAIKEAADMIHVLLALSGVEGRGSNVIARERGDALHRFLRFRNGGLTAHKLFKTIDASRTILVPDRFESFVYWSGRPHFRMRTFVMHFVCMRESKPLSEAARQFAKLIESAPCSMVEGEKVTKIWPPSQREEKEMTTHGPTEGTKEATEGSVSEMRKRFDGVSSLLNLGLRQDLAKLFSLAEIGEKVESGLIQNGERSELATMLRHALAVVERESAVDAQGAESPEPESEKPSRKRRRPRRDRGVPRNEPPFAGYMPSKTKNANLGSLLEKYLELKRDDASDILERMAEMCSVDTTRPGWKRKLMWLRVLTHGDNKKNFLANALLSRQSIEPYKDKLRWLASLYGESEEAIVKTAKKSTVWHKAQARVGRAARKAKANK